MANKEKKVAEVVDPEIKLLNDLEKSVKDQESRAVTAIKDKSEIVAGALILFGVGGVLAGGGFTHLNAPAPEVMLAYLGATGGLGLIAFGIGEAIKVPEAYRRASELGDNARMMRAEFNLAWSQVVESARERAMERDSMRTKTLTSSAPAALYRS